MDAEERQDQLAKLQNALVDGKIDDATYQRLKDDLTAERNAAPSRTSNTTKFVPMHFVVGIGGNLLLGLLCLLDAITGEGDPDLGNFVIFGAMTLALWLGIFAMAGRISLAFLAWIWGALSMNYSMINYSEYGRTHDFGWMGYIISGAIGAVCAQTVYAAGRFLYRLITPVEDNY